MNKGISAAELYERINNVLDERRTMDDVSVNRYLHDTLVLACNEATHDMKQNFGNLFSQVDFLCKKFGLSKSSVFSIQTMRRHTNKSVVESKEDLLYDLRALAVFISAILGTSIPIKLFGKIPKEDRPLVHHDINAKYIRCVVRSWDDETINAVYDGETDGETLIVDYVNTVSGVNLSYLKKILREGMQLNLLDCHVENNVVTPQIVVVEPDFLIDISSIAACFKDYGNHPLTFTIKRMRMKANSQAILLGNLASNILDDVINESDERPFSLAKTISDHFRDKAIDFSTSKDFNADDFKRLAADQANNIRQTVPVLFDSEYDRKKAILEPSFVCEKLGLQGRVDLMTTDMKLLVEQKSGKNFNIEHKRNNEYGNMHKEDHYVQVLLYYGVLKYNFGCSQRDVDIRLLYSKYPPEDGLLVVNYYRKLFLDIIELRNKIVASEIYVAINGFDKIVDLLDPQVLNIKKTNDSFYQRYLLPQIENVTSPLHKLNDMESAYLCRMMTFVYKEQLISKVGGVLEQSSCIADLWNMPLHEKIEAGNIYVGLRIIGKSKSSDYSGYDTIVLSVPEQSDDFLPNFRRGDMVYLYSYREDMEPDVRESILYKGVLTEIYTDRLTVHLNDGQQNPDIIDSMHDNFAVEHGASDISTSSAINGLHQFISSPQSRRDLLLCQRKPEFDNTIKLTKSYDDSYDDVLLKAKRAKDYFLLVGPPGTGKTSMVLRFIVEEELENSEASILLLSYTNRAVDEICGMLEDAGLMFFRLGNEYSCEKRYTKYLLKETLGDCPKLSQIRKRIADTKIIVSTTSMLSLHPSIFDVKQFSLAVIDEASQILEPNIVGLLGAHRKDGKGRECCCIDKFILVGDYKQLPAVVQQSSDDSAVDDPLLQSIGLDDCRCSLFERLIKCERRERRDSFIGILRKQGRMHPDIAEFPNKAFYFREQLVPVPCEHQLETSLHYSCQEPDDIDKLLLSNRMICIHYQFRKSPNVSDKVNINEAKIVGDLLKRIYGYLGNSFVPQKSVGVIVPYRNQIAMIRKEIEKTGIKELNEISIDTVERYQGSQRDVIIYSFTVQNFYQLDFLASNTFIEDNHIIDRKLNVAITRARKQMIMIGNPVIRRSNALFSELIDFVKSKD